MTQTTLKPNEFVIGIEEEDEVFRIVVRNPHTEAGQDKDFDRASFHFLCSYLEAAAKLKYKPKPQPEDESDSELYD